MRVAVLGGGYVGLVSAACLAETGNDVVCADVDAARVAGLSASKLPIYEPGLEELVRKNQAQHRLRFTTEIGAAVEHGYIVLIAVGTPHEQHGAADLSQVLAAARVIGRHMNAPKVVVTKSTVPVGTSDKVRAAIQAETDTPFFMASNPEFLKQGGAVDDFMKPDRVVVGVDTPEARTALEELYAPYVRTGNPIMVMDIASSELTKYAANAMLATRVSFINQIAELCERVGADVEMVRRGMAADRRIGSAFLHPGPGYGGSCFPKDVQALATSARQSGMTPVLFDAVEAANQQQRQVLLRKVTASLGQDLGGLRVAVWGLAFKAGTDDMRESPAIPLIEGLLACGAEVAAHDPHALPNARRLFGDRVHFDCDEYALLQRASALVVVTEWLQYRTPDFRRIRDLMLRPLLVDGRNLWDPARVRSAGFEYHGIGRAAS